MSIREWFGSGNETPQSESYVGLTQAAALDAAQTARIDEVRVFQIEGGTYATDFNPERLGLLIEDGLVVAAGFF